MTPNKLLALSAIAALAVTACGDDESDLAAATGATADTPATTDAGTKPDDDNEISIVGFAVPEAANKAIAEAWAQTPEGEGIDFKTSYGASGDQSRAVVDGLEA